MRLVPIVLGLSLAASAQAQTQADDDEKPGERSAPNKRTTKPDESDDNEAMTGNPPSTTARVPADTPPGETRAQPQQPRVKADTPPGASDTPPMANGSGSTESVQNVGDAPVRLKSRRNGPEQVHAEGAYAGVSLTGEGLPPKAPRLPVGKGPQRLTWPGFQVRNGVPTVFLQTTATPDYSIAETPGALVVTLHGTSINLRNNQRPLKVAEFGTDVREISAKPKGKDVVVTIARTGVGHHERIEASAGGFQILLVELQQKEQ